MLSIIYIGIVMLIISVSKTYVCNSETVNFRLHEGYPYIANITITTIVLSNPKLEITTNIFNESLWRLQSLRLQTEYPYPSITNTTNQITYYQTKPYIWDIPIITNNQTLILLTPKFINLLNDTVTNCQVILHIFPYICELYYNRSNEYNNTTYITKYDNIFNSIGYRNSLF
jgi:hypothetical protein